MPGQKQASFTPAITNGRALSTRTVTTICAGPHCAWVGLVKEIKSSNRPRGTQKDVFMLTDHVLGSPQRPFESR